MPGLIAEQLPDAGLAPDGPSTAGLVDSQMAQAQVLGYPIRRKLYQGEDQFFRSNPNVAGMAAEDGAVILNPYSKLSPQEMSAVAKNEAIRLHMRDKDIVPQISVTPDQEQFFKGTKYENADAEKRQTIVARILSGDPSVKATLEQQQEADRIMQLIEGRTNP